MKSLMLLEVAPLSTMIGCESESKLVFSLQFSPWFDVALYIRLWSCALLHISVCLPFCFLPFVDVMGFHGDFSSVVCCPNISFSFVAFCWLVMPVICIRSVSTSLRFQ